MAADPKNPQAREDEDPGREEARAGGDDSVDSDERQSSKLDDDDDDDDDDVDEVDLDDLAAMEGPDA